MTQPFMCRPVQFQTSRTPCPSQCTPFRVQSLISHSRLATSRCTTFNTELAFLYVVLLYVASDIHACGNNTKLDWSGTSMSVRAAKNTSPFEILEEPDP